MQRGCRKIIIKIDDGAALPLVMIKIRCLLCGQSKTPDFCRTLIKPIGFSFFLCTFYQKQMAPCPLTLDLGMQFIQVISQTQQKDLQFYPRFPSQ